MDALEIRPAIADDLSALTGIDHSVYSEHVWQINRSFAEGQFNIGIREIRLPRPAKIDYPRSGRDFLMLWQNALEIFAAVKNNKILGYIALANRGSQKYLWATDLAVVPLARKHGIGTRLVQTAQRYALENDYRYLILETQSKNSPAVRFAMNNAFEFCGYNDQYFENQDIALFFSRLVK